MELTQREADTLNAILWEVRRKAVSPRIPRNRIENLCDKATLILKKAARRRKGITKLVFTQNDIEL